MSYNCILLSIINIYTSVIYIICEQSEIMQTIYDFWSQDDKMEDYTALESD